MSKSTDCIVVGGGLIGMLSARELALAGLSVILLERGHTGRESSWAGGGILSPLYPWRYSAAVSRLARWGQDFYPGFCAELAAETGIDPQWTPSGLLIPELEERVAAEEWASRWGARLELPDAGALREIAPEMAPGLADGGIWLPRVAQVRNPRLAAALRSSLEQLGVEIRENHEVKALRTSAGKVRGVSTANEEFTADRVVVAGGAWSAGILDELGWRPAIEPVRGQMLLFRAVPGVVTRILLYKDRYVIPRRDGRVLVGSTLERGGFEKLTTPEAREALRHAALELVPTLADYPIEHHWAGLRPGSPDGVPFIGELPGIEGLYINAGHFRNGVVLGPASCRLLGDIVLKRKEIVPPEAYRPRLGG